MSNPDTIYWRRTRWDPWREYARLENLWFWPGEGFCVDGYIYWFNKKNPAYVCRLPMDEWILRGRRKRAPPSERPFPDVHQERLVPIRDLPSNQKVTR